MDPVRFFQVSHPLPDGIGAGASSSEETTTFHPGRDSDQTVSPSPPVTSEIREEVDFDRISGEVDSRILEGACQALHYPMGLTNALKNGLKGIKILRELGNGTMSQVYLIKFSALCDTPVVLKLCKFNGKTTDSQTGFHSKRLGGEMLGLYLKGSPYLLQILGVLVLNVNQKLEFVINPESMSATDGVVLGVFTEHLEGTCDLFNAIESNRLDTIDKVHYVAKSIAYGLYHLHTHYHLAHRDVKPENILIDKRFNVKIIDYGFLRENRRTRSAQGTPEYVAPEIMFADKKDYDPILSDAHSLASLFYTLRFGCFWNPFSAESIPILSDFLLSYYHSNGKMSAYFPQGEKPVSSKDAEFFDLIEKLSLGNPEQRWSVVKAVEEHSFFKESKLSS